LYKRIVTLAEHWSRVGKGLGQASDAYNKATAALETRVLVQARRFRDLHVALETAEIAEPEPIDHVPRALQSPEFQRRESDNADVSSDVR